MATSSSAAASAYLQRIGTALPRHDVHQAFLAYARGLLADEREASLFDRMAARSGIAHRWAVLEPGSLAAGEIDREGFYRRGDFPPTSERMVRFERESLALALQAVRALAPADELAAELARVTHVVVATCTGFVAPGLDVQLVDALGLPAGVERTMVGFMGCSAALPALRLARDAVRADGDAVVLVIDVELCSLHLRESHSIEELLSFMLFGDAAAAALVGARPLGAELLDSRTQLLPASRDLLTWDIGDQGFEMHLSGEVPGRIAGALAAERSRADAGGLLRGKRPGDYAFWAVHGGGRTVLDAVQGGLALAGDALADSRAVLRRVGNVSSATVLFVLGRVLASARPGAAGLALAFGPGLSMESMRLRMAGLS